MKRILSLVIGLVFCFSAAIASASTTTPILVSSGNYTSDNGIKGYEKWSTGVTFAWKVTNNGDGTYTYQYDWKTLEKNLSHLNIQVSDTFDEDNALAWSVTPEGYSSYVCAKDINYNFDSNSWKAFKFDSLADHPGEDDNDNFSAYNYTLTLTTNRMPMDGNFYAKDGDGGSIFAYNTQPIAVPNSAVPIPSTILLLGAGLAGLAGFKRKIAK